MHLGDDIEQIVVSLQDRVLAIAMNRPEKKNALIGPMYNRLADLIALAGQTAEIRAVYLCGTRDCFTSGNDVSTFSGMASGDVEGSAPIRFLKELVHCELPVVAAVNGPAIGVGTTMLFHCDFVIAGEDARFQVPFVNLGVCPEAGSSYTMPLAMGYQRAAKMLLLGDSITAQEALDSGMVSAVYPVPQFQDRAAELARRLAMQPPTSIRATKKLLRAPAVAAIEQAMTEENQAFSQCMQSAEFGEAITAFMEGRAADFSSF